MFADAASTTVALTTTAVASNSSGNSTSHGNNAAAERMGRFAPIAPAAIACCASAYVAVMIFLRRQQLYHTWNLLAFVMFLIQTVRFGAFVLLMAINIRNVPCAVGVTLLDTLHSAYDVSLILLFSVMMFTVCQEPERPKLFQHKMLTCCVLLLWAGVQIGMYLGAGTFRRLQDGSVCEIHQNQIELNTIFLWVPSYISLFLGLGFIFFIRSSTQLLSRRRVNIFAFVLFLSNCFDAVGTTIGIVGLANGGSSNPNAAAVSERHIDASSLVFYDTLFAAAHVTLLAWAFSYAEDLVPACVAALCKGSSIVDATALAAERQSLFPDDPSSSSGNGGGGGGGGSNYSSSSVQDHERHSPSPSRSPSTIFNPNTGASAGAGPTIGGIARSSVLDYPSSYGATGAATAGAAGTATAGTPSSRVSTRAGSPNFVPPGKEAAFKHTLTYFLSQQRCDIVSERQVIDSVVVRAPSMAGLGGGVSSAGEAFAANHYDNEDDIVSRASQTRFYSSSNAFAQSLAGGTTVSSSVGDHGSVAGQSYDSAMIRSSFARASTARGSLGNRTTLTVGVGTPSANATVATLRDVGASPIATMSSNRMSVDRLNLSGAGSSAANNSNSAAVFHGAPDGAGATTDYAAAASASAQATPTRSRGAGT